MPGLREMQNLQVHHLKFRCQSGGDEEQNLITVCAECHRRMHRRSLPQRPAMIDPAFPL